MSEDLVFHYSKGSGKIGTVIRVTDTFLVIREGKTEHWVMRFPERYVFEEGDEVVLRKEFDGLRIERLEK